MLLQPNIDAKRKASINYGLEKLNFEIEKPPEQLSSGLYSTEEMPGMEILDKFTLFNSKDFHFKWATLIFVINIYNYFTVAYFMGITGFPSSIWLGIELGAEIIMIIDIAFRTTLRNSQLYKQMWFIHESTTVFSIVCMLLASIPYSFICILYSQNLSHWSIALTRMPKLLRGVQITTYFTNIQIIRRIKGWLALEFIKYLFMVLIITHFVAMSMMFLERLEISDKDTSFYTTFWGSTTENTQIFTDIEFWALGSLSSITISALVPLTTLEKMFSVLYVIIGTSVFAAVFGKIVLSLEKKNKRKIETKQMLYMAKNWANTRKLSNELKLRVLNYYNFAQEKFVNVTQYEFISELPLSLRTEILLYLNKDLIPKVKLFELGDPAFMMGIVRHLKQNLYMAEDYIIRKGDYAEDFYIIKAGAVEILSTDGETAISILEEGGYFGEIGILLDMCRTVSVRATIATLITSIHRTHLLEILQNFPEHKEYLKRVAEQRLMTTNVEDFDANFDLLEEYSDCDSDSSDESEIEIEYYAPAEHKNKSCIEKFITVQESKAIPGYLQIDPLSYMHYIWSTLLVSSFVYYILYLPFAIAFENQGSWLLLVLDAISYLVFVVDIFISLNTSLLTEFGNYIHDPEEIRKDYYNKYLLLDIIAIIPSDYFSQIFGLNLYVILFSKTVRLLKYWKVRLIFSSLMVRADVYFTSVRIFLYWPLVVYVSHFSACAFFLACKLQYWYYDFIETSEPCFISKYNKDNNLDFLQQAISVQYIKLIYFTTSIYSSNTYNQIIPVTIVEECLCFVMLLMSRLMLALILAEASTLISGLHKPYTDQLAKVTLIKEWMVHYRLPQELQGRITNHYNLLWIKMQGVEDYDITRYLPESLQIDISYFLLSGMMKNEFFPTEEQGAIRSIMKKCRVSMQCAGEEIIREGELGMEMFFILEGEAEVVTNDKLVLSLLTQGSVFGEMALLPPFPSVRIATVVARTDVVLAVLSMEDFNFVMNIYPDFAKKVRIQASQREQMNRKKMHSANVNALRKHKKLSLMVRRSEDISSETYLKQEYQPEISFDQLNDIQIHSKKLSLFLKFHHSKARTIVFMVTTCWNLVTWPMAFAFNYHLYWIMPLEILTTMVYISHSFYYFFIVHSLMHTPHGVLQKEIQGMNKNAALVKFAHHFLLGLPLALIFYQYLDIAIVRGMFFALRLTSYIYILQVLGELKQHLSWFNVIRIIEVVFHFVIISHITACVFIAIGQVDGGQWRIGEAVFKENTQLDEYSQYLHSVYWAFTCLAHSSLGDVVATSIYSQLYNSLVCIFGWFIYAMLFGNISSLVFEFASKLRSKLLDSYNFVIEFIKKKRVDVVFNRQVNDYFNYLWQSNKGNIDSEIIKQLPNSMMCDIQMYRYNSAIVQSQIFKDPEGNINQQLTRTLFRLMEIQYYLIGDCIIKLGDKNYDIYIILEGEVEVINIKGNLVVATLKTGDHFGELNILINASMRTASVTASKISQIGVICKENLERMFAAYPDWMELLNEIAQQRVATLFNTTNLLEVNHKITEIDERLQEEPLVFKKYTKRAEKLIAPKIIEVLKNSQESKWFRMSFIHLLFIIYSAFAIPIEIAFDYPVSSYVMYIEALVVLESFVFFLITCKYSILIKAKKEMEYKDLIKFYYQNFIIHDIIAFSPFNLILPVSNIHDPAALIIILRMLRLFSVFRIPSLLQKLEIYSRGLYSLIGPLKAVFFLVMLIHWSSCLWYFIVSLESSSDNWINLENLSQVSPASQKWVHSMYFIMNIATGTGYSNTYPCTDQEIILTMLFILIGNILFAVAFGLIASLASFTHFRINTLLEKLRKVFDALNRSDIPNRIVLRLEAYYAFNDSLVQTFGSLDCKLLYSHLPKNIVNKITYECNKHILKKMPFFGENEFIEMSERISLFMVPKIYLPNDYIIYKNDIGEEMYFIILGTVDILSSDNKKVVKTLRKGDYVGEVALLFDMKRMCSVVASSLSLLYLLGKNEFRDVIKDFPKALEIMTEESNKRKAEASIIHENQKRNVMETIDEVPNNDPNRNNIVNTLNMYSAISNPFFGGRSTEQNMTVLTGMNNVKSELVRESYSNGDKAAKLYKRRPNISRPHERRISQESLGKEIVLSNFSRMKMQWIVEEN